MPKNKKLKDALLDEKIRLMECIMHCTDNELRSAYEVSLQSVQRFIQICTERNRF